MAVMSPEQRDRFLAVPRIAKLVYLRSDGWPAAVPVWFEWDGSDASLFTSRRSAKVGHLERDPRVALCVAAGVGEREAWVTIEGEARIEEGGWELAQRLAPRYYPPEKAAEALRSWGQTREDWVMIRIRPRRIRSLA